HLAILTGPHPPPCGEGWGGGGGWPRSFGLRIPACGGPDRHQDGLELGVFVEAEAAGFAAVAALFVAADRQFRRAVQHVVDPAAAGADAADGLEGLADVLAPDAGREP